MFDCKENNIFVIFIVLFILKSLVSANDSQPRIWIGGCTRFGNGSTDYYSFSKDSTYQASYQNECVTKINTSYICKLNTEKVIFTCEASYPIKWKIPHTQTFRTQSGTISNFSNLTKQNSNDSIYRTVVVIHCHYAFSPTSTLTCVSTDLDAQQSSTIFIANLASETNQIIVNPLILPCSHFAPNQTFSLQKQVSEGSLKTKWQIANISTFDPSVGYLFNTSTTPISKLLGTYRCPIDQHFTRHLYESPSHQLFNITQEQKPLSTFKSTSNITGNASVSLEFPHAKYLLVDVSMQLKCCSGVLGQPPVLSGTGISSKDELNYWKEYKNSHILSFETYHYDSSIHCHTVYPHSPAYLVSCQGQNVNFKEIYVSVFHSMSNLPVEERWKQSIKADNLSISSTTQPAILTRYVPESSVERLDVHQKIMMVLAHQAEQESKPESARLDFSIMFSDLFLENQTNPTNVPFYQHDKNKYQTMWSEYKRNIYYEGEPITVLCFGLKYLYATGGKLAIIWKNGSISEMELESFVDRQGIQAVYLHKAIFDHFAMTDRTLSLFSKEIEASVEVDSVECWMPVIRSRKWEKLRKKVSVTKASFLEQSEETVYLSPGEEVQVVKCTVADWKPSTNISVTWNDNSLDIEWRDSVDKNFEVEMVQNMKSYVRAIGSRNGLEEDMISIQIEFHYVNGNHSGLYKCIADNEVMNATRTVCVRVSGKSGRLIIFAVSISVIMVVAMLLTCLQYKTGCYWHFKRKLGSGQCFTS